MIGAGVSRPKSSAGVRSGPTNIDKKIENHECNTKVRDSGYLTNMKTGDGQGWVPDKHLNGNFIIYLTIT